jgi:hypothetical protein
MTEPSKYPSDFAVLAFGECDFYFRTAFTHLLEFSLIDLGFTFCKIDTSLESLEGIEFDLPYNDDCIAFGDRA